YLKMRGFGLSDALCMMYLSHDAARAEAAIRFLEQELQANAGRIRNRAAYLRSLIESGADLNAPAEQVRQSIEQTLAEVKRQREEAVHESARGLQHSEAWRQALQRLGPQQVQQLLQQYCHAKQRTLLPSGEDGYPTDQAERIVFTFWLKSLPFEKLLEMGGVASSEAVVAAPVRSSAQPS
ncbi:MAG: hypothetical protein N2690_05670, partial [Rhodocyclaceae bacterium]|nr:hypothetical protein [Rhodocyclaceae bacterium]